MNPEELANAIISKVVVIFNLERFNPLIHETMIKEYNKGLDKAGIQFNRNFIPDETQKAMLATIGSQLIKDFEVDMTNKLKQVILRAIIDGKSNADIKKEIKNFFSARDNSTQFDWDTRLDMILRTEKNRAYNAGIEEGGKQSGLKGLKKWLLVHEDARTSEICKAEDSKYGSEDKSVPLDEDFIVSVGNKTYKNNRPPFHPNCRTRLMFDTREAS